jgi:RNA polymerase sigma factor (sigma-70 family)
MTRSGEMPVSTDTQLQKLVYLARNGDGPANELLINHACDRLLRLTRKMFHGFPGLRRWEQTDDVFQSSLLRLHRALSAVQVESVAHFFNLAAEMVRRELLDLKKRHYGAHGIAKNHHTDHQPADEAGGSLSRSADEPDDLEGWSEFHEAAEQLPADLKETLGLIYYEGLSQEEAAEVLGVSVRTVKRRWLKTKVRLQEIRGGQSGRGTAG